MAKQRSPHCPQHSLQDALQKARKIYENEHTHPADRKVIAEDLGYSGINGPSSSWIGTLRQYGILEDAGDGLRISDDAVTVYELPEDSPDRMSALRRLAFRPPLFGELATQFGDRLPGEANLRHLLIKRGFIPRSADDVIKAFRDNFELAGAHLTEYNEGGENMKEPLTASRPETLGRMYTKELEQGNSPPQAFANIGQKLGAPLLAQTLVVSIPRKFSVNVTVQGDEIKKEDLAKIKSQFMRWIEGLEEAFE